MPESPDRVRGRTRVYKEPAASRAAVKTWPTLKLQSEIQRLEKRLAVLRNEFRARQRALFD